MERIKLERPTQAHKDRANRFKQEFFDCNEQVINGSALFDQMDYPEWLLHFNRNSNPDTVDDNWVLATTFFAVRESDQEIVGMIDIRHNLKNEFLASYGGHIGYSVRPSERKKGYASQMLKLVLEFAESIHLQSVMLGCYADNIASIKTILSCGGVLKEEKPYADGKPMHIYWIELTHENPIDYDH